MSKRNFSRSNVNESTLQVSQPNRSSFDLGSTCDCSLPLGKFVPVRCEHILPSGVLVGSISPEMTLKEIGVPQIGPLRLDTHTVAVSRRRINKDWVKVVKGSADSQPNFEINMLFGNIASCLFGKDHNFTHQNVKSVVESLWTTQPTGGYDNREVCYRLINRAASFYFSQVNSNIDQTSYNKDFYQMEHLRLVQLADSINPATHGSTPFPLNEYCVWDVVYDVMKPYFGEGSILDRLGYPIFAKYGRALQWLKQFYFVDTIQGKSVKYSSLDFLNLSFYAAFQVSYHSLPVWTNPTYEYADSKYYRVQEWDIRASYAAYFDSLRNWHVEESAQMPNPDDWATKSIFEITPSLSTTILFGHWCCFLIPRYRDYQNDLFTTIQTDDVFRHVFAPIFSGSQIDTNTDDLSDFNGVEMLVSTIDHTLDVLFPFGKFNRSANSLGEGHSVYANDLQTMRRAGMLEKYLARNYFFPDTFEGKMQARYGIDASDLLGVTSKYIEGGESFITGSQTINPTETAEMPAGSRTFQGGSAINGDTFSFAAGGDDVILVTFCSWMPIVTYSATNPHLSELTAADVVAPEFATDTRVQIQAMNLVRDMEHNEDFIGFVPRYLNWRARLNEVHGEFLTDKRSYVWLRDWYSTTIRNGNGSLTRLGYYSQFGINAYDLRVRMPLDGFLNLRPWDEISYGRITFAYSMDLPLPAAIEFI